MAFLKALASGRLGSHKSDKSGKERELPVVKLEIVSDTVCPFCYLLRNELHAAMAKFQGKLEFQVHWIAYQLQPMAPPEGVPKAVFMEQKFKGQAQYLLQKKEAFFKSRGLDWNGDGVIGNTFNSHRLIKYAGMQSLAKQDEVVGLLFRAFFAEAKHVNDKEVLRGIAHAAGLERPDDVIDDPACCAEEVRWELDHRYKYVIGVPHLVVNDGELRLGGAKDAKVYERVFQGLLDESRTRPD